MSCAESSDGERTVSPTAAATVRERRRLRLLKRRWNQGAATNNSNSLNSYNNNNGGMVLSFSAFRRARRMRHQRRMTKEEYLRLKNMVPAVATQSRVSKVENDWHLSGITNRDCVRRVPVYLMIWVFGFLSFGWLTHCLFLITTGAGDRRSHQIHRFSPCGSFPTTQGPGIGRHLRRRHRIQWVKKKKTSAPLSIFFFSLFSLA